MKEYSIKKLLSSKKNQKYRYIKTLKKCAEKCLKNNNVKKFFPSIGLVDNIDKKKINIDVDAETLYDWLDEYTDDIIDEPKTTDEYIASVMSGNSKVQGNNIIATEHTFHTFNGKKTDIIKKGDKLNKAIINSFKSCIDIDIAALKNLNIVFSSDPYDILTMSMRGINSCMKWKSVHGQSLIGSVLDRYCSVIYLTDNTKTKYGPKMNARAVVRYVKAPDNRAAIFIEEVYVSSMCDSDIQDSDITVDEDIQEYFGREVKDIFVEYIKSKVKDIPIIYGPHCSSSIKYYIYSSPEIKKLKENQWSYSDADLYYEEDETKKNEAGALTFTAGVNVAGGRYG